MDISLLSTFLCRCVSVIHRMSSEWCSTSAIMSSIFPRSALTFKVPINISSGVGRVSTKSYLAEVEFDVSMRSAAGMGVSWVEKSMQSDEPGVCSSSSIFVSVSGCFWKYRTALRKWTDLMFLACKAFNFGNKRFFCSCSGLVRSSFKNMVVPFSCDRARTTRSLSSIEPKRTWTSRGRFVLTVFDVVRRGGREGGVLKKCCSWPSGYL